MVATTACYVEEIISHFKSVNGVHRPYLRTTPFRKRVETVGLVLDSDFTRKELLHALAHLKTNRAVGIDEIPAEVLLEPVFFDLLLSFANQFLAGLVPLEVLLTRLVLVPKKGDKSVVANYRGVAIISVFLKLVNRLLLHRLRVLDPHLRCGQNGFRSGRGTSSHILAFALLSWTHPSAYFFSTSPRHLIPFPSRPFLR